MSSSTGNLNSNALDHLKKYSAFVGNQLGRLRGLGKYESRQRQASEKSFVYPEGHGEIVLGSGRLTNLDVVPGHLSFEMPCTFAEQVLPQLIC